MSMSTSLDGLIPLTDKKTIQMLQVRKACEEAGVKTPPEIFEYFKGKDVDDTEDALCVGLKNHACCKESGRRDEDGWLIDLSKLPEGVKFIRFANSY